MPSLLRFEGRTQEEARGKIRAGLGHDARIVRAGRERSGGFLGFFQREVYVFEVEDGRPVPARRDPARALPSPLDEAVDATASTLTVGGDLPGHFAHSFQDVLNEAEATIAGASRQAVGPAPAGGLAGGLDAGLYPRPAGPGPAAAGPVQTHADRSPAPERGRRDRLVRLGLAERLLPAGGIDPQALAASLATLPAPPAPPAERGTLVLVLGPKAAADRLGRLLSRALDTGGDPLCRATLAAGATATPRPAGPVAAAHRGGAGPLELARLIAARRIEGRTTVLAVGCGTRTWERAGDLVAALRPDATWAALAAGTSPEHCERIEGLVGRLDALALYDFAETSTPARLLGAQIPVGYVDWHRASPHLLAALLLERIDGRP